MGFQLSYSQNFLREPKLVESLLSKSSLTKEDEVLEIGPGKGIITGVLAKHCRLVIAVEADPKLSTELKNKFKSFSNVKIYNADFLKFPLPKNPYKIFSNIPFTITADIVRKITDSATSPPDSYLIMQSEAAKKYAGSPYAKESLFSVLHKPWFKFSIIYKFNRSDFEPVPQVDAVLLRIEKPKNALVNIKYANMYKDFVTYGFTKVKPTLKKAYENIFSHSQFLRLAQKLNFNIDAKPTDLTFEQWLGLFGYFVIGVDKFRQQRIIGASAKLQDQQRSLDKIHRTRTAQNWKSN